MALSSTTTPIDQLMTLEAIVSRVWLITTTSQQRLNPYESCKDLTRNEILDVKAYHPSLHIMCPLSLAKANMTFSMAFYVVIH
jgi:hypothetical protein